MRAFAVVAVRFEGAISAGANVGHGGGDRKRVVFDATHLPFALLGVERRGSLEGSGVAEGDGDGHGVARDSNGRRLIRRRDPRHLLCKLDREGGIAEARARPPFVGRVQGPLSAVRVCEAARIATAV